MHSNTTIITVWKQLLVEHDVSASDSIPKCQLVARGGTNLRLKLSGFLPKPTTEGAAELGGGSWDRHSWESPLEVSLAGSAGITLALRAGVRSIS